MHTTSSVGLWSKSTGDSAGPAPTRVVGYIRLPGLSRGSADRCLRPMHLVNTHVCEHYPPTTFPAPQHTLTDTNYVPV